MNTTNQHCKHPSVFYTSFLLHSGACWRRYIANSDGQFKQKETVRRGFANAKSSVMGAVLIWWEWLISQICDQFMTITITCVILKCVTSQCVFWLATALEERYIGAVHLHRWTLCFHPGWSCTWPAIPVLMLSVLSPASRAAGGLFHLALACAGPL